MRLASIYFWCCVVLSRFHVLAALITVRSRCSCVIIPSLYSYLRLMSISSDMLLQSVERISGGRSQNTYICTPSFIVITQRAPPTSRSHISHTGGLSNTIAMQKQHIFVTHCVRQLMVDVINSACFGKTRCVFVGASFPVAKALPLHRDARVYKTFSVSQ